MSTDPLPSRPVPSRPCPPGRRPHLPPARAAPHRAARTFPPPAPLPEHRPAAGPRRGRVPPRVAPEAPGKASSGGGGAAATCGGGAPRATENPRSPRWEVMGGAWRGRSPVHRAERAGAERTEGSTGSLPQRPPRRPRGSTGRGVPAAPRRRGAVETPAVPPGVRCASPPASAAGV